MGKVGGNFRIWLLCDNLESFYKIMDKESIRYFSGLPSMLYSTIDIKQTN